jgi:hypothetical protein
MEPFAIAGLAAAAIIAVAAIVGARRLRRLRKRLRGIPRVRVADAPDGAIVALEGVARSLATRAAPLSGAMVIGYRAVIWERSEQSDRVLVDVSDAGDFELEDASGRALVRGDAAQLAFVRDYRKTNGLLSGAPPEVQALLEAHNEPLRSLWMERPLAWAEHFLEEGEPVFVVGRARREIYHGGGAETGYREAPTRVVIEPPPGGCVFVADRLRDDFLRQARDSELPPYVDVLPPGG